VSLEQTEGIAPVLSKLKQDYPEDPDVLFQTARMHMKAWNDTIYEMFRAAPASYRVNQISAEIFEIQGKYTEAISEYQKAIEKSPTTVNLHYRLARATLMESHAPEALEAARQEFELELALNPRDAVAHYQVGQILLAQQKRDEGVQRIERSIELQPDFVRALTALAKVRMDDKQYDEAIRLLEEAVKAAPSSESARYGLMRAYRRAGRQEDALKQKEELERLQRPPEGEFTDFLKRIGEKPGQPEKE
jgi:tetratricopeptide (TPR) repeat protein